MTKATKKTLKRLLASFVLGLIVGLIVACQPSQQCTSGRHASKQGNEWACTP